MFDTPEEVATCPSLHVNRRPCLGQEEKLSVVYCIQKKGKSSSALQQTEAISFSQPPSGHHSTSSPS